MAQEKDQASERESVLAGAAQTELGRLKQELSDAREMAASMEPGDEKAVGAWKEIISLNERRLELFWAEHDNAGAFKIKKFDREVRDFFSEDTKDGRDLVIETMPDGAFRLAKGQEKRRALFVDMLELDRLNKEGGGHDAGDAGLTGTVEAIKSVAGGDFEIFRSGGNQFMVSFDAISDEDFKSVVAELSGRRIDISSYAKRKIDGAPLAVTAMDMKDVIEDLNAIQAEAGTPFESGEEAAREMMQIMLRGGDWGNEVRKFRVRAERMREKMEAPAKEKGDVAGFYENYVQKAMKGSAFETLDGFEKTMAGGNFESVAHEAAITAAQAKFGLDRGFADAENESVDRRVRAEIIRSRVEARKSAKGEPLKAHWARLLKEMETIEHGKLADVPAETAGQTMLREKKAAADRARHALTAAKKAGAAPEDFTRLVLAAENARIDSDIEIARRNAGTGLLERGTYYEDLERALNEKKPTVSVFVDMGFLKYFDQKGGVDVGNAALKGAAHLMERALAESGLKGEVYRYGGDEFTVLFEGARTDASKFTEALSRLREEFGRIPAGPKSGPEYAPSELQFNYGVSDTNELDETIEYSGRRPAESNKKAEVLTKIADTRVEYMKAVSRFDVLIKEMIRNGYRDSKLDLAPESGEPNALTAQVEAKIGFSRKAIFAEMGGEAALRVFADEMRRALRDPKGREGLLEEVEDQVRRFVMDRMEQAHGREAGTRELMDRFMEARTKISVLEEERDKLRKRYDDEHKRVKDLEAALGRARQDFESIKSARSSLAA